ncbi:MAG: hypothetical protein ACTHJQ_24045 [Rhizobiaceae bacterium]
MPKPIRGPVVREGFFSKDDFRYDRGENVDVCPSGATLLPLYRGKSRDNVKIDYSNRDACKACHLRERCTRTFCRVSRPENEAADRALLI